MYDTLKTLKSESSRRVFTQQLAALSLGLTSSWSAHSESIDSVPTQKIKKLCRIFIPGGLSHLDSFDPKPKSPDVMGDTKTIHANTGTEISGFFPQLAKRMDKIALIRGMSSPEGDHERGQYLMRTSYQMLGTIKHPTFGVWMNKLNGSLNEDLPATVNIRSRGSAGFLGSEFDPFGVSDPNNALEGLIMNNPKSEENTKLLRLMADVRRDFHNDYKFKSVNSYAQYYNDSIKLMRSEDLDVFDIEKEEKAIKEKYLKTGRFGANFLLARRLIEANVQSVNCDISKWDDHYSLWKPEEFPSRAGALDRALSVFLDDMYQRGLMNDTVVTLNTEFGRTPEITPNAGRDHYRKAYCSIMAGAGVKNGIVYGKTDETGSKVIENSVSPVEFNTTLAKLIGLNVNKEIFSPDNRPFTVVRKGNKIIDGLIA